MKNKLLTLYQSLKEQGLSPEQEQMIRRELELTDLDGHSGGKIPERRAQHQAKAASQQRFAPKGYAS